MFLKEVLISSVLNALLASWFLINLHFLLTHTVNFQKSIIFSLLFFFKSLRLIFYFILIFLHPRQFDNIVLYINRFKITFKTVKIKVISFILDTILGCYHDSFYLIFWSVLIFLPSFISFFICLSLLWFPIILIVSFSLQIFLTSLLVKKNLHDKFRMMKRKC